MTVLTGFDDDRLIVKMIGTLEHKHERDFDVVENYVCSSTANEVIFDMSQLAFMTSLFWGRMLVLKRQLTAGGRQFTIQGASAPILSISEAMNLFQVFDIREDGKNYSGVSMEQLLQC